MSWGQLTYRPPTRALVDFLNVHIATQGCVHPIRAIYLLKHISNFFCIQTDLADSFSHGFTASGHPMVQLSYDEM